MIDDKTGKPTGNDGVQELIAQNARTFDIANRNFVNWVISELETWPAEHMKDCEKFYADLFDGILPGLGRWVTAVFAEARKGTREVRSSAS